MKKYFLLLLLVAFTQTTFGQYQMKITLKDGSVKSGIYKIKDQTLGWASKTKIISKKGKEKYNLQDIQSLVLYTENDSLNYEVIRVKKYMNSKSTELKLGQVGFKGSRIELYYVSEYIYQGGATTPVTTASPYHEKYLRKKNGKLAYNLGYLYGAGQRGIKKRIREYFTDCPALVAKVDKGEIPKKETLEIALFYEKECSK